MIEAPFGVFRAATAHTTRAVVAVTFLRQEARPLGEQPRLPGDTSLVRLGRVTVPFYRYLYDTVGGPYLWWLRRTLTDGQLADMLGGPGVSVHVLYRDGEPAGFFELERRMLNATNINYFGLMPHAVGQGMGPAFLAACVAEAWSSRPAHITVNTCTADHPRALPNYIRAGFTITRTVQEVWDIPNRLGLTVPPYLRG